jgi:predicted SAM-dependent methyltransferase
MTELWAPKIYTFEGYDGTQVIGSAKALDIGCGSKKLTGAIGMDILSLPTVDVVCDVNNTPWPFTDNTFDLVFLNHCLEHVNDVVATLEEIHRILKPGGRVVIQVPYFRCVDAYNDPTHKHFFTSLTLDYFIAHTKLSKYHYSKGIFIKKGFWFGWLHDHTNPIRQMIKVFIHKHPEFYDKYLSQIITVRALTWELEKPH